MPNSWDPNPDRTFGAEINEDHPEWKVQRLEARSAHNNKPGYADFHFYLFEEDGMTPALGVEVQVRTSPSVGLIAPSIEMAGYTKPGYNAGYAVCRYRQYIPGGAAIFQVFVGDDILISDLTTIIKQEYDILNGVVQSWRPVNKTGQVTYDIELVRKP